MSTVDYSIYAWVKVAMKSVTIFLSCSSDSLVICPSLAMVDSRPECEVLMCCENSFSKAVIFAGSSLSR